MATFDRCWRTRAAHRLGLAHCIPFYCLTNGSNHLAPESHRTPRYSSARCVGGNFNRTLILSRSNATTRSRGWIAPWALPIKPNGSTGVSRRCGRGRSARFPSLTRPDQNKALRRSVLLEGFHNQSSHPPNHRKAQHSMRSRKANLTAFFQLGKRLTWQEAGGRKPWTWPRPGPGPPLRVALTFCASRAKRH
jgi:hypothetical protein